MLPLVQQQYSTHTYLAVMDVVSSGPAVFARLFTMLPLKEIVHHGIILGTSSSRHTLEDRHMNIIMILLVRVITCVQADGRQVGTAKIYVYSGGVAPLQNMAINSSAATEEQ